MKHKHTLLLAFAVSASCLPASALEFDFKDPKGASSRTFRTTSNQRECQ